jgi:1-deoxy-D-xylulose-5-phosphate synthase
MSILEELYSGKSIKQLNIEELTSLCNELREKIIETVSVNGGHLSPNLGSIELTVALHYVFDNPSDKFIFDVGHQSYAHKILSGRYNEFSTIRQEGGLSGFPNPQESECDAFIAGHAGTSISAGLGYCRSRDALNEDYFVVSVVGDASFFNGENLEAITSTTIKPRKFLIILNDNGMSISKNNNGLYKTISKITIRKNYNRFNSFMARVFGNSAFGRFLRRVKNSIKRGLSRNTISDSVGLKYVGKFDGHNLKTLIRLLKDIKNFSQPTLLHLQTVKGKGLDEAEKDSSRFHGVSKDMKVSKHYFSGGVSKILSRQIEKYPHIQAITAGMKDGVGLSDFAKNYPNSFIDVGIQEEFAVTLAGGMAKSGTKPIVFMYSTFMQRAYDQILHDVCIQNLSVVFCIDRAGFVGNDGVTHQGLFDISYLSHIPNLTILAPTDIFEFEKMLDFALSKNTPFAIRYPNGGVTEHEFTKNTENLLSYDILTPIDKNVILAVGPRMLDLAIKVKNSSDKKVSIINARCIKPLDCKVLDEISDKNVIILEENVKTGGFSSAVINYYAEKQVNASVTSFAVEDKFISHASVDRQLILSGFTVENIKSKLI